MSLARISRHRATPAPFPSQLSPAMRQRIGDAIDALLAALDAADGDPDLEDCLDVEAVDEREPDNEGDPLDFGERNEVEGLV